MLISLIVLSNGCTGNADCAKQGEQFSVVYEEYPNNCCNDLTEWNSGFDTRTSIADECYETGLLAGSPVGTCINCGNGICEEIENPCNCLEDCNGKGKSTFNSSKSLINWGRTKINIKKEKPLQKSLQNAILKSSIADGKMKLQMLLSKMPLNLPMSL